MLEMLRNVLYILQRSQTFAAMLGRTYRERTIDNHLRSVPIFASLLARRGAVPAVRRLPARPRCELLRLRARRGDLPPGRPGRRLLPGPDRVREGVAEPAGRRAGPELRRAGRILRRDRPAVAPARAAATWPRPGVRTATCTALDHVDLVRITAEDFRDILDQFPDSCGDQLVEVAMRAAAKTTTEIRATASRTSSLGDFLGPGPDERPEPAGARPGEVHPLRRMHQGLRRRPRRRDAADPRGAAVRQVPGGQLVPIVPRPVLHGRLPGRLDPPPRDSREIIIEDWCIGCGKCAENCPYGNINMHPFPTGEKAPDPTIRAG